MSNRVFPNDDAAKWAELMGETIRRVFDEVFLDAIALVNQRLENSSTADGMRVIDNSIRSVCRAVDNSELEYAVSFKVTLPKMPEQ